MFSREAIDNINYGVWPQIVVFTLEPFQGQHYKVWMENIMKRGHSQKYEKVCKSFFIEKKMKSYDKYLRAIWA